MTFGLTGPALDRPSGTAETLAGFIQSRVGQMPGIRYIEVGQSGERASRSAAELHGRALEILPALLDRVPAGRSDVVLCFDSALDFVSAAWACIYGGYSCFALQVAKSTGQERDIRSELTAIGKRLDHPVLLTTASIKSRLIDSDSIPFATVICIDGNLSDQSATARATGPLTLPGANAAGDAAFLVATSGTTAAAKIAVITYRCALNRLLAVHDQVLKLARLVCSPFDGLTGMQIVYPGLADCVYLHPGRLAAQPLELLKLVEEFQLQSFGVSSSILAGILHATEAAPQRPNLSALRQIGLGAEMIVPDVVRRLGTRFREMGAADLKVVFRYGMTEAGMICATEPLDIDRAAAILDGADHPLSVGNCIPGFSLRIVDREGKPLPPGTPGHIEIASDLHLFSGYRNDPEQNNQSFTQDGWFRTGDIGSVGDGGLTITGREKATIIVNAKKIALEAIEAPLRRIEYIRRSLIAAAAVRRDDSSTDELAVFFAPRDADSTALNALCRVILDEVGRHSGIPVKHFVPVSEADFPLTPTGKIRRDELTRLYQSGVLTPHLLPRLEHSSAARGLTDNERWLTELWQEVLGLDFAPAPDDSFFELGGDSLASARLIAAVEERFSCELPLEAFFRRPTIATLSNLVKQNEPAALAKSAAPSLHAGHRLLHKLQSYTGSWPGERLFDDSLVVGLNSGGSRTPIFWVFQKHDEFQQLAKYLGSEQPLYGMRSCIDILRVSDYTTDVIETVCNRYLWEILSLPVSAPFFVGGNCQAGIFALALARRLKQIGRTPSLLILMEWVYSYGGYTEPTLLLYGDQSPTAAIYRGAGRLGPNWREDFPERTVVAIPGEHGAYFSEENVVCLADVIRRYVRAADKGKQA